ncbi:hypothetical protein M1466_01790 [Candidatus Dependentiae bacterium]|nr:hypothetical protein [Candidatus Dependentiae bacterium]
MVTKQLTMLAMALLLLSGTSCLSVFNERTFLAATIARDLATVERMIDEAPQEAKDKALLLADKEYEKQLVFTDLAFPDKDFKPTMKFLILRGANFMLLNLITRRFLWDELRAYLRAAQADPEQYKEITQKIPKDLLDKLRLNIRGYPWPNE